MTTIQMICLIKSRTTLSSLVCQILNWVSLSKSSAVLQADVELRDYSQSFDDCITLNQLNIGWTSWIDGEATLSGNIGK